MGAQHRGVPAGHRRQVERVHGLRVPDGAPAMFSAPKLCQSVSTSGPSAMLKPMAPKIAAISSIGAADRMDRGRRRGARRQRDVDPLGGEPCGERRRVQCRAARLDPRRELVLQPVERGAALAAQLGRGRAQILEQRCQPAVRPSTATRTASHARRSAAAASAASVSARRASCAAFASSVPDMPLVCQLSGRCQSVHAQSVEAGAMQPDWHETVARPASLSPRHG